MCVCRFSVAMFLFLVLSSGVVLADPMIQYVWIEGAHVVSEGAYFRFWVWARQSENVTVTVNDQDAFILGQNDSIDYNVVAPQVQAPYEVAHYVFKCYRNEVNKSNLLDTIDYQVLVLDTSMVQFYFRDLLVPLHVILVIILIAAILILAMRKKRISKAKPS